MTAEVLDIVIRRVAAGGLGACIGFERRDTSQGDRHCWDGPTGSTTYMLLGRHLAELDPSSISRHFRVSYPVSVFSAVRSFSRAVST